MSMSMTMTGTWAAVEAPEEDPTENDFDTPREGAVRGRGG
jgi:hypothetical protein